MKAPPILNGPLAEFDAGVRRAATGDCLLPTAYSACDACGDSSQWRLMLCARCWRKIPAELTRAWLAARTGREILAAAAAIMEWAAAPRSASRGRA